MTRTQEVPSTYEGATVDTQDDEGEKVRQVKVKGRLWDDFGVASKRSFTNRADVMRAFMAWYSGWEGARLPERPEPPSR